MVAKASGNAFDLPFTFFTLGLAAAAWLNASSPLTGQSHRQRQIFGLYFAALGMAMSEVGVLSLLLVGMSWPLQHPNNRFMLHFGPLVLRIIHRVLLIDLNGTEAAAALATGIAALALFDLLLPDPSGQQTSSQPAPALLGPKIRSHDFGRFTPPGTRQSPKSSRGRRRQV